MEETPVVHHPHQGVSREPSYLRKSVCPRDSPLGADAGKAPQGTHPYPRMGQAIAPDAVAMGQGNGLQVHHMHVAGLLGQGKGQVGQEMGSSLQHPDEPAQVREVGEVGPTVHLG